MLLEVTKLVNRGDSINPRLLDAQTTLPYSNLLLCGVRQELEQLVWEKKIEYKGSTCAFKRLLLLASQKATWRVWWDLYCMEGRKQVWCCPLGKLKWKMLKRPWKNVLQLPVIWRHCSGCWKYRSRQDREGSYLRQRKQQIQMKTLSWKWADACEEPKLHVVEPSWIWALAL